MIIIIWLKLPIGILLERKNLMKKVNLIIILFILQFAMANSLEGNKIPKSRIKMLNGKYAKLSDFNQDGPMIINFWTTWWPACERQAAYLDQLNESFSSAGLKVLGVNINGPTILNQVRPWINKRKINFDISVDPSSKLAERFNVRGLPTFFLVDKNGTVINQMAGFTDGDEYKYLEELKKYLDSEYIEYENFDYKKQSKVKKDATIEIDF